MCQICLCTQILLKSTIFSIFFGTCFEPENDKYKKNHVKCLYSYFDDHQDVGSNPATARNENQTLGDPLHRRWPKGLDRISVEDRRCKAELDL